MDKEALGITLFFLDIKYFQDKNWLKTKLDGKHKRSSYIMLVC